MDFQIFLIFCLCACNYKVYSQSAYVRLQSPAEVRYKIDKLVLSCDPQNVATSDSVSDIIIQKNSTTGWKDLVKVLSDISTGTLQQKVIWTDVNMQNRASVVTAIVAPTSQAGLHVEVIPINVACLDKGMYRCEITGNRGSGVPLKLDSQSSPSFISLKVEPLTINPITVNPPQPENMYYPNTIITMTCYGDVGNPPEDLRWCYKRSAMDFSYTEYEDTRHIIQETASMSDCQYRRTSTLTYNVSKYIEQVDFRCETGGVTTQCGHTSAIAANFTVYQFKEDTFCNRSSSTVTIVILSVLLSIVTLVLACVLLFIAYNRYLVQKRDRVYEDTKDRRNVPEHAYDRTDYHMYDTSN